MPRPKGWAPITSAEVEQLVRMRDAAGLGWRTIAASLGRAMNTVKRAYLEHHGEHMPAWLEEEAPRLRNRTVRRSRTSESRFERSPAQLWRDAMRAGAA